MTTTTKNCTSEVYDPISSTARREALPEVRTDKIIRLEDYRGGRPESPAPVPGRHHGRGWQVFLNILEAAATGAVIFLTVAVALSFLLL